MVTHSNQCHYFYVGHRIFVGRDRHLSLFGKEKDIHCSRDLFPVIDPIFVHDQYHTVKHDR